MPTKRFVLLSAFGLLMALSARTQTTSTDVTSVAEPEFADVFYRLEAGKLMPLERQNTGTTHVSVGFGMKGTIELPGGKSTVRFHSGERIEFIVRTGLTATQDPSSVYHLRSLSGKKDKRVLLIMAVSGKPFSATAKSGAALGELPLEFSRYGASSIKASSAPLPRGEYAVGTNAGMPGQALFCFGVD
jgi:hypothetical protein